MGKRRKCKTCGRVFVPSIPKQAYCSEVCRMAGCFVGGGGDTSKPVPPEMRKKRAVEGKAQKPSGAEEPKRASTSQRYERVHYMLSLPLSQRWAVAKTFTPEEQRYSVRLQKRMLLDMRRMESLCCWEGEETEEDRVLAAERAELSVGESDDGSV